MSEVWNVCLHACCLAPQPATSAQVGHVTVGMMQGCAAARISSVSQKEPFMSVSSRLKDADGEEGTSSLASL